MWLDFRAPENIPLRYAKILDVLESRITSKSVRFSLVISKSASNLVVAVASGTVDVGADNVSAEARFGFLGIHRFYYGKPVISFPIQGAFEQFLQQEMMQRVDFAHSIEDLSQALGKSGGN